MSKPIISNEDLEAAEKFHGAEDHNIHWMARELRERRANDLTAEERAAMEWLVDKTLRDQFVSEPGPYHQLALALAKIVGDTTRK